jgi:hypothetical protein
MFGRGRDRTGILLEPHMDDNRLFDDDKAVIEFIEKIW